MPCIVKRPRLPGSKFHFSSRRDEKTPLVMRTATGGCGKLIGCTTLARKRFKTCWVDLVAFFVC
eukprot:2079236-Amphidinium_carterae.1